jgi:hypothetical protein
MNTRKQPRLVPTGELASYFRSNGIAFTTVPQLSLGFGQGNDQYCLFPYPGPADDETMGIFFEWHTEDFFAVDSGPHLAIGLRGPLKEDPHRGRGLAIGILASQVSNPDDHDHPVQLFRGCPDPPGGPAFFIEDFTLNKVTKKSSVDGVVTRNYTFMGQAICSGEGPGYSGNPGSPCPQEAADRGQGNAFIGSGFADPETRSRVDNIHIAHWKN